MYDLLVLRSEYATNQVASDPACTSPLPSPIHLSGTVEYPFSLNTESSMITLASTGGLMFGVINIVGNFGTVFVDQSYWQNAVAATPYSSVVGFFLGGLVWFAIPFTLATSLGLAAQALGIHSLQEKNNSGQVASELRWQKRRPESFRSWSHTNFLENLGSLFLSYNW